MSDCCSVNHAKAKELLRHCRVCGSPGKKVERLTLEHLLQAEHAAEIADGPYHFCETPHCDVIYFNNEKHSYFRKAALKVRVGIKQTDDPIPLCYCFGHTEKTVRDEIKAKGFTTVIESIKAEIKAGHCACEIKNPAGHCCLGTVSRAVQRVLDSRASTAMTDRLKPAEALAPDGGALEPESYKPEKV